MSTLELDQVVRAVRDLPSLPVIVMELLETMEQEDASSALLAHKISQDQALTAKILRVANSSFYGMSARVTTVAQALSILGFSTVRALVTAASISGAFVLDANSPFNFSQFWKHAIATAICAKHLAPFSRVAPDSAFITGLLHDIGQLVLATKFAYAYAQVTAYRQANDCAVIDAERHILQLDHAMVGAALSEHWRFPLAMQQAVLQHHAIDSNHAEPLTVVIHIANTITHALDLAGDPMEALPDTSASAWQSIALDSNTLSRILPLIVAEFGAISPILAG